MKIALVHHWFPELGGTERYVQNLFDEYKNTDNETYIFTSKEPAGKSGSVIFIRPVRFLGYLLPSVKDTVQKLRQIRPDMIHVQSPHPYATLFGLIGKILKIKVISTYHADANPKRFVIRLITRFERTFYRFIFRRIIATTDRYNKIVSGFYPQKRIVTVPLGIEKKFFEAAETGKNTAREKIGLDLHSKIILFIGRLDSNHYYKGVPYLISAAEKTPGYRYVIIGDGDKRQQYQDMAERLNTKNVFFAGNVSDNDLPLYYRAADIFILPSTSSSEGYGLVLLESIACETPVITTSAAGSSEEIIDSHAGIIITPNSALAIEEAIGLYFSGKESHLRTGMKRFIQNRTIGEMAKKTLQQYQI